MPIKKDSFMPLYHQLSEELKKQIKKGKFKPGDPLPSESALIKKYELSRGTVRQAMQKLEIDGLIDKFPGRGTFVSEPEEEINESEPVEKRKTPPIEYQSIFAQLMHSTSLASSITVEESGRKAADVKVKNMMKLKTEEEIYYTDRSLVINDNIWAIEKTFFPLLIEENIDKISLDAPVYEQFAKITGHKIILSKYIIEMTNPDEQLVNRFQMDNSVTLFNIISIAYLEDNTPFELSFGFYRADRVRINFGIGHLQDESKFSIKALKEFR
ncbi:MAG: GntR family transcriptional regulator [Fidelibacterota bacterium]